MSDLSDEIRRRVEAAKEFDKQQREEKRRQASEQADLQEQRKSRAGELNNDIGRKLREAAGASEGAMRYVPAGGVGITHHILQWQSPRPERNLEILVDYFNGVIERGWNIAGQGRDSKKADALEFDVAQLDALILMLTNQAAWSQGIPKRP